MNDRTLMNSIGSYEDIRFWSK